MTARFSTSAERDFFRAQSNFTGRLVEFAKKFEVHVHLVAHPRKAQGNLEADDVSGSGDITNRADNVFSLDRLDEKDARAKGYDAALKVLKNRSFGETPHIGLCYDPATRRYRKPGEEEKHYAWEFLHQQIVETMDTANPFF
jgi:twinkle protein